MISHSATRIGLLLAGGQSKRMGQDKALLQWKESTLLEHQLSTLRVAIGSDQVYVSGVRPGTNFIPDETPGLGPIEGLRSTLSYLQKNKIGWQSLLVMPLDMPFLPASALKELLSTLGENDFVQFADRELPIALRNTTSAVELLDKLKNEKNHRLRSFQNFLGGLRGHCLPTLNPQIFENLNTQKDYREAISAADIT